MCVFFLSLRPIANDLDRWMQYWITHRNKQRKASGAQGVWADPSSAVSAIPDAVVPPQVAGKPAKNCADLFDWDKAELRLIGGLECVSVPFIPGYSKHSTYDPNSPDASEYLRKNNLELFSWH